MLTPEGAARIWAILTGQSDDSLAGGAIEVGAADNRERSPIKNFRVETVQGAVRLTVDAEFAEDEGNVEWSQRSVLTKQGIVLDTEQEDGGRKAQGSVWSIEVDIDLMLAEAPEPGDPQG